MELNTLKNDTVRANAIRTELATLISAKLVESFGEENVVNIGSKITVFDSDIAGNTVVVKVGTVNVNGEEVDAVATISATVKAWKTKTNKAGRTTYAISLDNIKDAIELEEGKEVDQPEK